MLFRLNHELLPEPGSPMASTTVPLLGRCEAIAVGAGVDAAIASVGAVCGSTVGDFGAAEATDVGRLRPRPPRPRRRRGRPTTLAACDPVPVWAGVADSEAESKSASLLCLKSAAIHNPRRIGVECERIREQHEQACSIKLQESEPQSRTGHGQARSFCPNTHMHGSNRSFSAHQRPFNRRCRK